jgi:hypothetical protein
MKVQFNTRILKFDKQGEKTGWTYIDIPVDIAIQLKPGNKKSFRVRGFLDKFAIQSVALIPMGEGNFIMALNASMRKQIGKREGAMLTVTLEEDTSPIVLNVEFMDCLADDPAAHKFFNSLTKSHQHYFSKWIESAKTEETKTKRIVNALHALSRGWGYPEMIRSLKKT